MRAKIILFIILIFVIQSSVLAEEKKESKVAVSDEKKQANDITFEKKQPNVATDEKKWAVEAELTQPFIPTVHIAKFYLTRTVWGEWKDAHGEAIFGVFIRPKVKHDVVEVIDEYAASVGYRHYFNSNWHVEGKYYTGYVWATNNLTNQRTYRPFVFLGPTNEIRAYAYQQAERDYAGRVQFIEATIGYRFFLNEDKTIYLLTQFGVFHGIHGSAIIGPRDGKTETFPGGGVQIGLRF